MSWARHNVEKYDEIITQGVANRYGISEEMAEELLAGPLREQALSESNSAICDAEADYFGGLVDAAMDTMESRKP